LNFGSLVFRQAARLPQDLAPRIIVAARKLHFQSSSGEKLIFLLSASQ
jgi:hypothetical protein